MNAESVVKTRPYQDAAVSSVFKEFKSGKDATLVVMATGTGKTVVAGTVAKKCREMGRRCLFLAHTDNLLYQAQNSFTRFGLSTAIEMANLDAKESAFFGNKPDVVLGSIQTLRGARLKTWPKDEFGLMITDECHHGRAATYESIFNWFTGTWHMGLTATPDRGDGKNLGAIYESIAFEYNLKKAIREGYLVPIVQSVCQTDVDLKNLRTTGGDYNEGDLVERISPHIEKLVDAAVNEIGDRKTAVFTPDVGTAQLASDAFNHKGKRAAWIAGMPRMSREQQKEVLEAYAQGDLDILCCAQKLAEGWDDPPTSCVVIMRPTKKRSMFAQMIGRGTRLSPGKTDCLIVNFAWETTAQHELCTTMELFDDSEVDDGVMAVATRMAKEKKNEGRSLMDIFDEAEKEYRRVEGLKIKMSGSKANYEKFVFDPVGVGKLIGVQLKQDYHLNSGTPLSEKQDAYLRSMGLESTDGLNRIGASRTIEAMLQRREKGLATIKQVRFAISLGMDPVSARDMLFSDASAIIDELKRRKKGV